MELRVAHLYPDLLNLYGDRGNLLCLRWRAGRRGIPVRITPIRLGEPLDPEAHDLIFLGGGEDRQQALVSRDLQHKAGALHRAAARGVVILGVCGGYQLLGHAYRPAEGEVLPGVGLLDAVTEHPGPQAARLVGDVVAECALPGIGTLVGYENHGGRTRLGPGARPLARVVVGFGNNGQDRTEGAVCGTVFGTYLHGPVLPKNPRFADHLIRLSLRRRYGEVTLAPLDDRFEEAAHRTALLRARVRNR
ncbi:MAG: glutamine amidotransferase [Armatimonadota bacterium]|nr:glutamine amidotransferase [Armatimonadota bacterium]MDR7439401.1 glutamine amidotransferase [Armatimonadota bacterium]MDR7563042.1 glutamine amidotransferase [Armatimonadota bacterium]MDR7602771.1 glutamine amidotransferase [Armatimonadota bacterium]